jgi:tetratricopeptide (TPR) repeat protein
MVSEVVYLSPRHADGQLQAEVATLAERKKILESLRAQREDQGDDSNEAALLRASERIIASSNTLYAESVASGSVWGDFSAAKSSKIHEWIAHADALASQESRCSTPDERDSDSIFSGPTAAEDNLTENSVHSSPAFRHSTSSNKAKRVPSTVNFNDIDSDSGDDFSYEAAQYAIEAGREAFDKADYTDAGCTLEEALRLVRELPIHRQASVCDSHEIRYMLAVCSYHLQDPASAKIALISILDHMPNAKLRDDHRGRQVCNAGYMLAETCIKLGELDQARTYCDSAMQGRRRLLGKTDSATYDSLALLARILYLQGQESRARIFAQMLPDTHKARSQPTEEDLNGPSKKHDNAAVSKTPDISSAIRKDIEEEYITYKPMRKQKSYMHPTVTDDVETPVDARATGEDTTSAKANFPSSTSNPPTSPPLSPAAAFKEIGNKSYKAGDYEAAIVQYSKGARASCSLPPPSLLLTNVCYVAIEVDRTTWIYLSNRAAAYMAVNRYQEAMQDCASAGILSPHNPKIIDRVAKIHVLMGKEAP